MKVALKHSRFDQVPSHYSLGSKQLDHLPNCVAPECTCEWHQQERKKTNPKRSDDCQNVDREHQDQEQTDHPVLVRVGHWSVGVGLYANDNVERTTKV